MPAARPGWTWELGGKSGAWQRTHDALQDRARAGRIAQSTAVVIDSQTGRGADAVAAPTSGCDAGKIKGRKRHTATDIGESLLAVVVTAASIQDRNAAHRLMAVVRARFDIVSLCSPTAATPGNWSGGRNPFWH